MYHSHWFVRSQDTVATGGRDHPIAVPSDEEDDYDDVDYPDFYDMNGFEGEVSAGQSHGALSM